MLKNAKYAAIAIVGSALAAAASAPASAHGARGQAYGYEGGGETGGGRYSEYPYRGACADSYQCLRKAHRALRMWTYDRLGHVPRDRTLAEMADRIREYYGRR
jgi:hypothetical protein